MHQSSIFRALTCPTRRSAPMAMSSIHLVHQTPSLVLSTPVLRLPTRTPIVKLMLPSVRKSIAPWSDVLVPSLVVHGKVLSGTSPPARKRYVPSSPTSAFNSSYPLLPFSALLGSVHSNHLHVHMRCASFLRASTAHHISTCDL